MVRSLRLTLPLAAVIFGVASSGAWAEPAASTQAAVPPEETAAGVAQAQGKTTLLRQGSSRRRLEEKQEDAEPEEQSREQDQTQEDEQEDAEPPEQSREQEEKDGALAESEDSGEASSEDLPGAWQEAWSQNSTLNETGNATADNLTWTGAGKDGELAANTFFIGGWREMWRPHDFWCLTAKCSAGSKCCENGVYGLCGSPGSTCCFAPGSGTINLCAPGDCCNFAGNCYAC